MPTKFDVLQERYDFLYDARLEADEAPDVTIDDVELGLSELTPLDIQVIALAMDGATNCFEVDAKSIGEIVAARIFKSREEV